MAEQRYYTPGPYSEFLSGMLADYYSGKLALMFPTRGLSSHRSSVSGGGLVKISAEALGELPGALLGACPSRVDELVATICDMGFVHGKCAAGMVDEMCADMDAAAEAILALPNVRRTIFGSFASRRVLELALQVRSYRQFLRDNSHHLRRYPNLALAAALNGDARAPTTQSADLLRAAGWMTSVGPWIENSAGRRIRDEGLVRVVIAAAHGGAPVRACVASPMGSLLLAGGDDGAGRMFSATLGTPVPGCVLGGHSGAVLAVAFGGGAKTGSPFAALTGGADGQARLFTLGSELAPRATLAPISLGHPGAVTCLAFSSRGDIIATSCAGDNDGAENVRLWAGFAGSGAGRNAAPPGTLLALLDSGHTDRVTALHFSPLGTILGTASRDGSCRLLSLAEGSEGWRIEGFPSVLRAETPQMCFSFDRSGRLLASGSSEGFVHLWSTDLSRNEGSLKKNLISSIRSHPGAVLCCSFSQGNRLVTGCVDGVCRLWSVPALVPLSAFNCHSSPVTACQLFKNTAGDASSKKKTLLLTSGADGDIRVTVAVNKRTAFQKFLGFLVCYILEGHWIIKLFLGTIIVSILLNSLFVMSPIFLLSMLAHGGFFTKMEYQIPYFTWAWEILSMKQDLLFSDDSSRWRFFGVAHPVSVTEDRGPGFATCKFANLNIDTGPNGLDPESPPRTPSKRAGAWLRDMPYVRSLPFLLPLILARCILLFTVGASLYVAVIGPVLFGVAEFLTVFSMVVAIFAMKTIANDIER